MDYYPVFLSVLCSAVIAFIGWKVLFSNAKKLATRSESHAFVKDIFALITDIADVSQEFWLEQSKNKDARSYDAEISLKIKHLQSNLTILISRKIKLDIVQSVVPIRKTCTLNSTELVNLTISERTAIMHQITNEISAFKSDVNKAFENRYPPS